MVLSNQIIEQIERIKTAILDRISDAISKHYQITGSASTRGHVQAGGIPSNVSATSSSAGQEEGKYARSDHVHKIDTASTTQYGVTKLSDNINSSSSTVAASSAAVQSVYTLINGKSTVNFTPTQESGDEIGKLKINNNEVTLYSKTYSNGLLSEDDRRKLDSIQEGANQTIVDSNISSESANPVENKEVKRYVDSKLDNIGNTHNHDDRYNKTEYSQIFTSNINERYEIGQIKINGSATTIYGKDTNTTYGIKAGGGLSLDGTQFAHSNDINASTGSESLKKIKYDSHGHITSASDISLANVATSGSYNDLINKPTIITSYNDLSNKPNLSAVATSGSYNDLTNKPTIITSYNDLSNKPNLSTVATSGSYNDLSNKPNLSSVATSGSYNDLTNKPTIITSYKDLDDREEWEAVKIFKSAGGVRYDKIFCNGMFVFVVLQTYERTFSSSWIYLGHLGSEIADEQNGSAGVSSDYLPRIDEYKMVRNNTIIRLMSDGKIYGANYNQETRDSVTVTFLYPYKTRSFFDKFD